MLFATIIQKNGQNLAEFLSQILFSLCQSTLEVIKYDFLNNPDFRIGFFKLIHSIINHCQVGLLSLEPQKFQTIIDSILFGIKHTKTEIMEISLQSLYDLNTMICNYN